MENKNTKIDRLMKVLIVEDETNYADTLEMFLDELGYNIIGIAPNGKTAISLFDNHNPDIVLMDINLEGELTGIDLARIFQGQKPTPIIFLTSFEDKDTFAKAKQTGPFAYLIKPFQPDTLQRNIELALQNAYADGEKVFETDEKVILASSFFFIKERSKLIKIKLEEILWIEVEDKYCMVHIDNRKFALRKSLKEFAKKLDSSIFVQTHRSFIVNTNKIDNIDLSLYVVKVKGVEIPLGRAHKDEFIKRIQLL